MSLEKLLCSPRRKEPMPLWISSLANKSLRNVSSTAYCNFETCSVGEQSDPKPARIKFLCSSSLHKKSHAKSALKMRNKLQIWTSQRNLNDIRRRNLAYKSGDLAGSFDDDHNHRPKMSCVYLELYYICTYICILHRLASLFSPFSFFANG